MRRDTSLIRIKPGRAAAARFGTYAVYQRTSGVLLGGLCGLI
jgi:hypothetical protein